MKRTCSSGPCRLLGTYLLETKPSAEDWKALFENVGGADLRPVWQRAVLTSSLHSTRATQLLRGVANYLLENNGDHLRKMLMALATTEVLPNPVFLDEKLTPDIEPADRTTLAHHAALPKAVTWVRFLDWLMPLVPTLPPQLIPDLLPVFATWQNAFAGNRVRHCRQIGELSYGWLTAVEEANHARDYRDVRAPFGGALNGRDIEKSLRTLFLSSVGDVPNLGAEYLRKKLADQDRLHIFRGSILSNCGALVRHLPTELVDFFLGAFLERPEDRIDRFGGYSDHLIRELGVAKHHQFYPASPIQPPFLASSQLQRRGGIAVGTLPLQPLDLSLAVGVPAQEVEKPGPADPNLLDFPLGPAEFLGRSTKSTCGFVALGAVMPSDRL